MGTTTWNGVPLCVGYKTSVAGKQVVLDAQVSFTDVPRVTGNMPEDGPVDEEHDLEAPRCDDEELQTAAPMRLVKLDHPKYGDGATKIALNDSNSVIRKFVSPVNFYAAENPKTKPRAPLWVGKCDWLNACSDSGDRYDPKAEGAIVMKAPTNEHQRKFNSKYVM